VSPPGKPESFLRGGFRLACRATIEKSEGEIHIRTLKRGALQIAKRGMYGRPGQLSTTPTLLPNSATAAAARPAASGERPRLGLAVDAGTTTVVCRLVDLTSHAVLSDYAFENPQVFAGSDVMARIAYDGEDGHGRQRKALAAAVNQGIKSFDCDYRDIVEVAIVGNTTMRDIVFGLDVQPIGQKPYRSVTETEMLFGRRHTTALSSPARKIGLMVNRDARAYGAPLLGSHVGADAAACLSVLPLEVENAGVVALMDIGTNTEIVLSDGKRTLTASCPAGPAFEGKGITCGMPAFEGAMDRIAIEDGGRISWSTISNAPAQGICGSGLISLLGELKRTGLMNELGRLTPHADRFIIDPASDIHLSEGDISELAQAKGAHWAGLAILANDIGIGTADISHLFLAGGFSQYLDVDHARRIGLIPNIADDRITVAGNLAIEGATRLLVSQADRTVLDSAAKRVEHIELESSPDFFDLFVEGCHFKPMDV